MTGKGRFTWRYRCRIWRVVDGDTVDALIDLGRRRYEDGRLRLRGVNTPELKGATLDHGAAAQDFVLAWILDRQEGIPQPRDRWNRIEIILPFPHAMADPWPFVFTSHKDPDSFGRYLAAGLARRDGDGVEGPTLQDSLLETGHAVEDIR